MPKDKVQVSSPLPAALQDKYDVVEGVLPQFADSELGYVDLSTIDEQFAARLEGRGYLTKKPVQPGQP